jgi:predicted DNA repair protein MutK
MFLVGGGILVHGLGPLHHAVQSLVGQVGEAGAVGVARAVLPLLLDAVTGVVAGALALAALSGWQALRRATGR